MKIQVIETRTKQPLANTKIQIQVKGKDSGYLSFTTDAKGCLQLDEKYKGQQIAHYLQGSSAGQWVTAAEDATVFVAPTTTTAGGTTGGAGGAKDKTKTTTQSYK